MKIVDADGNKREIEIFYEKVPSGNGRPIKVLTQDAIKVIEKLAAKMCSEEEISSVLDMSCDTLHNKYNNDLFRTAMNKGKEEGKVNLRRMQWASAEKGNVRMQIWLGKQYLGQKEKIETSTDEELQKIIKNIDTVTALIKNPSKDRDIGDFE